MPGCVIYAYDICVFMTITREKSLAYREDNSVISFLLCQKGTTLKEKVCFMEATLCCVADCFLLKGACTRRKQIKMLCLL